jgi:hypothetical protein
LKATGGAGTERVLALDRETREKTMNTRLNTLSLGGFLALASFLAQPVMADEWNKKTEFQFSGPVEIPGKVLTPGKYVFQLVDSESDRNIVQVFSEDSNGLDTLVATLMAIPDYISETPDKPTIHFDERPAGTPEAIHSWFYPGENTGWEFVYPKGETMQKSPNTTPAQAPVATASAPSATPGPEAKEAEPTSKEVTVLQAQVTQTPTTTPDTSAPAPEADTQGIANAAVLPETGGSSGLEQMTGLAMLGGGLAAIFASTHKSIA